VRSKTIQKNPDKDKTMNKEIDCLAIGELRTNAKGGKSANVTQNCGKSVIVTATVPLQCPFGASLFQDDGTSTRLNIDFAELEGLEAIFRSIDEQLILAAIAAKDSLWIGKNYTDQQIREFYTSPLKEREGYSTTLRAKLDTEKCRCWSWDGGKISLPESKGKGCMVCPKIQLQNLWFMSPKWGATFQVTDLRIQEPCVECPW
jgi:hypothetical protein